MEENSKKNKKRLRTFRDRILHWVVRQYDTVFLKGIFLENPMVLLYRKI